MQKNLVRATFLFGCLFGPVPAIAAGPLDGVKGKIYYVDESGQNNAAGTREAPFREIDKALKLAKSGDAVAVAGGRYNGTFGIGFLETAEAVQLYGSFAPDFGSRDIQRHPSLIAPDNASAAKSRKPMLSFSRNIDGAVVDGFVFDMGERNSYHATKGKPVGVDTGVLLLPPAKRDGDAPTVVEPIIKVPSAAQGGDLSIRNNVFLNGANFAIQAGLRSGTLRISNNVFVANRMAAIEVFGTCAKAPCGTADIGHNTILLTWSRLDDMLDMGYGVRIMTKLDYAIHDNVIGGNVLAGVDHTRFNADASIRMDRNVFFANKKSDLKYSPASNTNLDLRVSDFGDLPFASADGNRQEAPGKIVVNAAYLDGYINATYKEQTSLDRDAPVNQWRATLGMPLVGSISTDVSMFANRYPRADALGLFGAAPGVGAQAF